MQLLKDTLVACILRPNQKGLPGGAIAEVGSYARCQKNKTRHRAGQPCSIITPSPFFREGGSSIHKGGVSDLRKASGLRLPLRDSAGLAA
jgi:hypothetical protein